MSATTEKKEKGPFGTELIKAAAWGTVFIFASFASNMLTHLVEKPAIAHLENLRSKKNENK